MVGTWCLPEILKALEKGYKLLKTYEVYHFNQTSKYDRDGGYFLTMWIRSSNTNRRVATGPSGVIPKSERGLTSEQRKKEK